MVGFKESIVLWSEMPLRDLKTLFTLKVSHISAISDKA